MTGLGSWAHDPLSVARARPSYLPRRLCALLCSLRRVTARIETLRSSMGGPCLATASAEAGAAPSRPPCAGGALPSSIVRLTGGWGRGVWYRPVIGIVVHSLRVPALARSMCTDHVITAPSKPVGREHDAEPAPSD